MDPEKLKSLLLEHKVSLEKVIKEKIDTQSDAANEVVGIIKADLEETKKQLGKAEETIQRMEKAHIPGLKAEIQNKEFNFANLTFAMLDEAHGKSQEFAWRNAGYEKEIIDQYAKQNKDYIAGDGTQGGYIVPVEASSAVVDMTIANMPVMDMGVKKMTGLYGDLPIQRRTGRSTGYWLGETEAPTFSTGSFDEFTLRPKKLGAVCKMSRRWVYQTKGQANQFVKEGLSEGMALTLEAGLLNGIGSASQVKGILQQTGYTIVPAASLATNGARFRSDKAASMVQALDVADELKVIGNYGFLMHPTIQGGLRRERVPQFTGQAIGQGAPAIPGMLLMSNEEVERQIGYKMRTTTLLSNTLTRGTSTTCSNVIFGNWSQFYVGFWRDLEFRISEHASDAAGNSAFLKDQFYVLAIQEVDCNVGRTSAFVVVPDAETAENLWSNA